ncbi:hypothetical protein TWF788_009730 [Orbilia oligospora]|uniref:Protein kinase domain-containing protein n=1 Tax=Orbilia oligospora TaxID=2813651 RepID=A0A7C8U0M1_ORBOL|nr:hypothetical protein TWF788_009730 [Orbilia oligospora]
MYRPILAFIKSSTSRPRECKRFFRCSALLNKPILAGPDPTALKVEFRTWKTFFDEVNMFSKVALEPRFDFSTFDKQGLKVLRNTKLEDEDAVKDSSIDAFETPCLKAIETIYGGRSRPVFRPPSPFLNIGFPSRVLIFQQGEGSGVQGMPIPKLLVNTKTPHELPLKGVDIVTEVNKNRKNGANKYLRAVHQLHSYMYYNKVDYGILTTIESTRVFRRIHTTDYPEGLLECSPEIDIEEKVPNSPLAAYLFAVFKAFRKDPTYVPIDPTSTFELPKTILLLEGRSKINTPIPGLKLGRENQAGKSAKDLRFLLQDTIRPSFSKVVRAKAFIAGQDPETCTATLVIVKMYKHLSSLQGTHIPRLYVSGDHIDGGYGIVVLEDCGKEMNENRFQDPAAKEQAKKALLEIHRLGVLHGVIRLSNIIYDRENGSNPLQIRIIDFGDATLDVKKVTDSAKELEIKEITSNLSE